MSDSVINGQIVAAVQNSQANVVELAQKEGQSIAYQKVAQATAFAVQDATDYLRNIEAIATAAQGVALSLMLETKNPFYLTVLTAAQEAVTAATANYTAVGTSATGIATEFPAGS